MVMMRRGAGSAQCENGCKTLVEGNKARLSSDNQPTILCVYISTCARDRKKLGRHFGSTGAVAGLGTGLVAENGQCVCVCVLHYVVACLTGLEVTWWGPVGTRTIAQRHACVFMCVVCIIGLAVTWCGTVGVVV